MAMESEHPGFAAAPFPAPLSIGGKTVLNAIVDRVGSPFPDCHGGADQSPVLYEWLKEAIARFLVEHVLPPLSAQQNVSSTPALPNLVV